jgi:microcystin-dependent protein
MNRANFQQTGGFPLETDTLDFMQESYTQLQQVTAAICGDSPAIISGCNIMGSTVTEGWVVINRELLPFEGGPLGTRVGIVETTTNKVFEDTVERPVYTHRKVVFNLSGSINWTDLKRIEPLNTVVPKGLISMWSGAISNIPTGWLLCDGTNGTPNLKGKFIVGYDSSSTDYNSVGKTGGAEVVTLTGAQSGVAPHSHTINDPGHSHSVLNNQAFLYRTLEPRLNSFNYNPSNNMDLSQISIANAITGITINSANAQNASASHENRPPFYTLAYIIKA